MKRLKLKPGDTVIGVYYDSIDPTDYGKGLVDVTGHIIVYTSNTISKIFFESVDDKLYETSKQVVRLQ